MQTTVTTNSTQDTKSLESVDYGSYSQQGSRVIAILQIQQSFHSCHWGEACRFTVQIIGMDELKQYLVLGLSYVSTVPALNL